jgi:uncharacterized protein YciI
MHWLLFYDFVDNMPERRGPFRDAHLALARAAHERGELIIAGAFVEPPNGAVLIFRGDEPVAIEAFVANDPYVANGLVTSWRIRPWLVGVGLPEPGRSA